MASRNVSNMTKEEFQAMVQERRVKRMAKVDSYPPEIRGLIHEYGLNVVTAIMQQGVKKPNKIRHIVETVLDEFSPTRGTFVSQGTRAPGHRAGALPR